MKTLITFLGKPPKGQNYKATKYDFGNNNIRETAFFGLELKNVINPDRMVVLGTTSSMWDVLVEHEFKDDKQLEEKRLSLIDAVEHKSVNHHLLDVFAPVLSEKLACECLLRLIPFGKTNKEQIDILKMLSDDVNKNDEVYIDITHGFRHLPFLVLLSALYIKEVKKAEIKKIYYGALEMTEDNITPVINLDGLLQVSDWVRALAIFDNSGDYGVFVDLFAEAGVENTQIECAAFYERTFNPVKASEKLTTIPVDKLKNNPISSLFADTLEKRISWFKKQDRWEKEKELAWLYFDKKDYVRATAYAFEAIATQKSGGSSDYVDRNTATETFADDSGDFRTLRSIRNELVHGTRGFNKRIQKIIDTQKELEDTLDRIMRKLLPR